MTIRINHCQEMAPGLTLVHGGRALTAVQREMHDIPIMFAGVSVSGQRRNRCKLGASAGNVTGFTVFEGSSIGKLAGLLKAVAPDIPPGPMIGQLPARDAELNEAA
jgi:hypothetical protein